MIENWNKFWMNFLIVVIQSYIKHFGTPSSYEVENVECKELNSMYFQVLQFESF